MRNPKQAGYMVLRKILNPTGPNSSVFAVLPQFHTWRIMELTVNPRKLEHRSRMIYAGIPFSLLQGHEANDVPTF